MINHLSFQSIQIKGISRFITAVSLLCCSWNVMAQTAKKKTFPFNEFGASLNYSVGVSPDYSTHLGWGGGLLLHKCWRTDKKINWVAGMEYQNMNFQIDSLFDHENFYYQDLHFHYHQFRIPFSMRVNFGKTTRFFLEPGVNLNIVTVGYFRGKEYNTTTHTSSKEIQMLYGNPGFGAFFTMGVQVPYHSGNLLIQTSIQGSLSNTLMASDNPNESNLFYNNSIHFSVLYRK